MPEEPPKGRAFESLASFFKSLGGLLTAGATLVGGIAALVVLLSGSDEPPNPTPSSPPPPQISPEPVSQASRTTPNLSRPAMALIDVAAKRCSHPEQVDSAVVEITSPEPDAGVRPGGEVQGTVELSEGDALYFGVYAPGVCSYYFDPWAPVTPESDNSWQANPNLSGVNPGEKVFFCATVVDADGHLILAEVIQYWEMMNEAPFVYRFPSGARSRCIPVEMSS